MLMTIFYVHKMVESHQNKYSVLSLIFVSKFWKKLDKVYNNFKDCLKVFKQV